MTTPSDTPATNPRRELAAIMFSDIVGYTLVMGRDEGRAMRALAEHRALLRALLPKFNGRMLGEIGDGTLTSFHSAVDAVNCAREVQAALKDSPDLRLRIGIHLGDVLFTDDNAWGDGVNVASRIHALTPPGAICVSEHVYDAIRNQPGISARDLGRKRLKNVSRPIAVYLLFDAGDSTLAGAFSKSRASLWMGPGKYRALVAAVAVFALAALAFGIAKWKQPASNLAAQPAAAPRVIRSIAVLPLDNYSGDPNQEYFADGMTDELTTDLATISALRVISRSSVMQFKGEHRPPTPEIARALNVDAVVEGSVFRVGDRVRITAQLIDAPDDKHLWAKSYERDSRDVLTLQDELASAIAQEINVQLTPQEQARFAGPRPVNPAAHEAYLKGRYFFAGWSKEGLAKALAQYEEAIKIDPNFAPAYSGIADVYSWDDDFFLPATEVMPKAKAAAQKALQLDDTLAEAHTSLGIINAFYDFDWPRAEREFRRAIELNPSYALAHDQYGFTLGLHGRLDEAVAESKLATELDPLSPGIPTDLAVSLSFQGKYDEAAEQTHKAIYLDPNGFMGQFGLAWVYVQQGRLGEAISLMQKARLTAGAPQFITGWLGYAYAKSGDRVRAEALIVELDQMSAHQFVSPWCAAVVYVGLGDKQRALEGLEKAYERPFAMVALPQVRQVLRPAALGTTIHGAAEEGRPRHLTQVR